jgi:hypothetical protein
LAKYATASDKNTFLHDKWSFSLPGNLINGKCIVYFENSHHRNTVAMSETMIAEPSITQMTAATANLMHSINTIENPVAKLH